MNCRESVDIYISATNLKRMDLLSKTDPCATLFYMGPSLNSSSSSRSSATTTQQHSFTSLGSTETIQNNSNPTFKKKFNVYYYFECVQKLNVEIYDEDTGSSKQFIGKTSDFTLSQVVCSREGKFKVDLLSSKGTVVGQVLLIAEKVIKQSDLNQSNVEDRERRAFERFTSLPLSTLKGLQVEITKTVATDVKYVQFKCKGINLDKKDFFGKSDPYFFFEKEVASRREKLYQSEIIDKTLNPNWNTFALNLDVFNQDYNKSIIVKCFDSDNNSNDDLIGEFTFTLDMVLNQNVKQFNLIEPTLVTKKKNYQNSGIFEFESCYIFTKKEQVENPEYSIFHQVLKQKESRLDSFLDYLFGGCSISVSVGIDFTGSNGDYKRSDSLHYLSSKPNQYQEALGQVLQILEPYDIDKMYGAYGYGAQVDKESMQPMFNLSLTDVEDLYGADGILQAYIKAIPRLSFGDMGSARNPQTQKPYRGDDFYRVIEHVVQRTPIVSQQSQCYNILLLVIDGDAFDMQGTIDSIIEANDKPISIVIVGVGGRSFSSCRKFDADDTPLVHTNGMKMTRDIVQFVSFTECDSVEELAKEVLAEIPKQMVQYFESKGIVPNARPMF